MPRGVDLVPLQMPGREARISELAIHDMSAIVAEVVEAILPLVDGSYALLGHSAGAWVAFEVARELRKRGASPPRMLVVAASPAPQRPRVGNLLHQLPDAEFVTEMTRRFDGIPSAIAAYQELLQLLLPAMRADMRLLETYEYADEPPLATELIAMGGTDDRAVSATALADWRVQTSGTFTSRLWPGGHFFLFQTERNAPLLSPAAQWLATRFERYAEP